MKHIRLKNYVPDPARRKVRRFRRTQFSLVLWRKRVRKSAWEDALARAIAIVNSYPSLDAAILRMTRRGRDAMWYVGYAQDRIINALKAGKPRPQPRATTEKELVEIVRRLGEKEPIDPDKHPERD